MTRRRRGETACYALLAGVSLLVQAVVAMPQVVERATEEVMPGVRVRIGSGNVIVQARPQPCEPPCADPAHCVPFCREAVCPPGRSAHTRCIRCGWECRP